MSSVDNLISAQKKDEEKLNRIKMIYDNTINEYIKQVNINKKIKWKYYKNN